MVTFFVGALLIGRTVIYCSIAVLNEENTCYTYPLKSKSVYASSLKAEKMRLNTKVEVWDQSLKKNGQLWGLSVKNRCSSFVCYSGCRHVRSVCYDITNLL